MGNREGLTGFDHATIFVIMPEKEIKTAVCLSVAIVASFDKNIWEILMEVNTVHWVYRLH